MTQNTEVASENIIPYNTIGFDSWNNFDERLKEIAATTQVDVIYVHPSGAYCSTKNFTEASIYLNAFKGAIILNQINEDDYDMSKHGFAAKDSNGKFIKKGITVFTTEGWYKTESTNDLLYGKQTLLTAPSINADKFIRLPKSKTTYKTYQRLKELSDGLDINDLRPELADRKHPELYEEQEKVLTQMQETNGFHLLSGEVGVGKTHIAAAYINSLLQQKPDSNILIVEPIPEVANKFTQLIHMSEQSNVQITSNTLELDAASETKYDLIVFDEFHKFDKNKHVSNFPMSTPIQNYPDNIIAMTGTVSNNYPEQIWSVAHNYIAKDKMIQGMSEMEALSYSPYNPQHIPQLSSIRSVPEHLLSSVLKTNMVQLLRSDIKELETEKKMPINKISVGIDLSPQDKLFYNMLKLRAGTLQMTVQDNLAILDEAFNTNQSEFIVQPIYAYQGVKKAPNRHFQLVDPKTIPDNAHNLYYLGRHDEKFIDKKINFINNIAQKQEGKILVYLTNDSYGQRVTKDLTDAGVTAEFINTREYGAVDKINNSSAKAVVFDITPISEGVDLKADNVVWYSTPTSAGMDEQACGRITRLSSTQSTKNFYYLYHKTTIQQDLTENIIKTNNVNNIALNRDSIETMELDTDKLSL